MTQIYRFQQLYICCVFSMSTAGESKLSKSRNLSQKDCFNFQSFLVTVLAQSAAILLQKHLLMLAQDLKEVLPGCS